MQCDAMGWDGMWSCRIHSALTVIITVTVKVTVRLIQHAQPVGYDGSHCSWSCLYGTLDQLFYMVGRDGTTRYRCTQSINVICNAFGLQRSWISERNFLPYLEVSGVSK
jgi:hypothetical protein